jgi:hypothetical protein
MAHPLQSHSDYVSALLRELRNALKDHVVFRGRREAFNEYLEAKELELALHPACGGEKHPTPCSEDQALHV